MASNINARRSPDPAGYPQAGDHAFSQYALAFDEFAEPRTIPNQWDLSGLLVPDGSNTLQRVKSPSTDNAGR